jgi:hypothetical protein
MAGDVETNTVVMHMSDLRNVDATCKIFLSNVTKCNLVQCYQYFGGNFCFHFII